MRYQLLAACLTGVVFGVPSLSHAATTYQVLYDFNSEAAGSNPLAGVLPGSGGKLYGLMDHGGSAGFGLDYVLVPSKGTGKSREIVLHNFTGGADGAFPYSGFGMNAAGVLFGAVLAKHGSQGTLYSLTPLNKSGTAFSLATLFTFSGANGDGPEGAPVVGADGALYGVTVFGGTANFGTIYKVSPPAKGQTVWTETVLHSFTGKDGQFPQAGLTQGPDGVFYGTTTAGGTSNLGTVFQIAPPAEGQTVWTETVLHSFTDGTDGDNPFDAGVALDKSGALFGTTLLGGTFGTGIAFKLTPPAQGGTQWTEAILHSFGNGTDGEGPLSKLVIGKGGTMYGTLSQGGPANLGLVYSLTPAGHGAFTYQTLHAFAGGKDGGTPPGDLSMDASGTIFGTASAGSAHTRGTIFSIVP
jgi:uncharacterized repeat protein (TIGR03803 family)